MPDEIKIGDMLWGAEYGRPQKWRCLPVADETSQSWLLGTRPFKLIKVNKKTMLESVPNLGSIKWLTAAQKNDEVFRREHRHFIAERIYRVEDVAVLRQIADLIGYKVDG